MSTYRVGNHQPQNVYRGEQYIGVMFTAEDAELVVEALNHYRQHRGLGCSLHGGVALGTADGGTEWIDCSYAVCGHPPQPPHPTCVDVSNLRAGRPPGSEWVCGVGCPKPVEHYATYTGGDGLGYGPCVGCGELWPLHGVAGGEVMDLAPVSFADACAFVAEHHRHHAPPVGHKFSLGVAADQVLVGVAIVGRPVARTYDDGQTLEVTRVATDGTPHAASMLYAAAWRAAKALGYRRLVTYTQQGETGASLRAAGWTVIAERPARPGWNRPSRPRHLLGTERVQRYLWEAS